MRRQRLLCHERRLSEGGFRAVAGVDEAGRGPLAGPVVAGAVILRDYSFTARVDDSKLLSGSQRERAYAEILTKAFVGVGIVDERTIDRINIFRATQLAMERAVASLEPPPDYVLADGTMRLKVACPHESIIGGDGLSLSIAAASIVAKVTRDRIMRKLHEKYPQYGFSRHKGYGTAAHFDALRCHGPCPIHRRSFSPIRDVFTA